MTDTTTIMQAAADLLGPTSNRADVHPEYTRAIVELTINLVSDLVVDFGYGDLASTASKDFVLDLLNRIADAPTTPVEIQPDYQMYTDEGNPRPHTPC